LEEFFPPPASEGAPQPAGRAWLASELRGKGFPDLHGLWFVCLKERNFLLTERLYYRGLGYSLPDAARLRSVKKTMAAIKVVIGERARASKALEQDKEREKERIILATVRLLRGSGGSTNNTAHHSQSEAEILAAVSAALESDTQSSHNQHQHERDLVHGLQLAVHFVNDRRLQHGCAHQHRGGGVDVGQLVRAKKQQDGEKVEDEFHVGREWAASTGRGRVRSGRLEV
jgi:hypothetical protein